MFTIGYVNPLTIKVGSLVRLYPYADGENGPHPSDLDQPVPECTVVAVHIHPNNEEQVEAVDLIDKDTGEELRLGYKGSKPLGSISKVLVY